MKLKEAWKKPARQRTSKTSQATQTPNLPETESVPARDFTGSDAKWGFTQRFPEASPTVLCSAQAGTAHCLPACSSGFFLGWPWPALGMPAWPGHQNTSVSAAHASAFLLLLLLWSSSPVALGGLLPHYVDHLIGCEEFDGAATDVAHSGILQNLSPSSRRLMFSQLSQLTRCPWSLHSSAPPALDDSVLSSAATSGSGDNFHCCTATCAPTSGLI